jgi:hypothetical protein
MSVWSCSLWLRWCFHFVAVQHQDTEQRAFRYNFLSRLAALSLPWTKAQDVECNRNIRKKLPLPLLSSVAESCNLQAILLPTGLARGREKPPFRWVSPKGTKADYFSEKRRFFIHTGKNNDISPGKSGKWC